DHVDPLITDTLAEGGGETGGRIAHVVADHHGPCALLAHQRRERRPHLAHEALVDLLADEPAHVVRLDHGVHRRRRSHHYPRLSHSCTGPCGPFRGAGFHTSPGGPGGSVAPILMPPHGATLLMHPSYAGTASRPPTGAAAYGCPACARAGRAARTVRVPGPA